MQDVTANSPGDELRSDPWLELVKELDEWRAVGLTARFWWRDDDAVAPTTALMRLVDLSVSYAIPLGLSVIPEGAEYDLAITVSQSKLISVLQHGIAHKNNAPSGAVNIELGGSRNAAELANDLLLARSKLAKLFGPKLLPVLVPPWNLIEETLVAQLPELGYHGLSTAGPRRKRVERLVESNAHIQPITWAAGPPKFVGTQFAMKKALLHLRQRRYGEVEPEEPIGVLTHHLDSDEDTWAFVQCFLGLTRSHPAAIWISPTEAFGLQPESARNIVSRFLSPFRPSGGVRKNSTNPMLPT